MAVGALVKAREWQEWFAYWRTTVPQTAGWMRLLVDTAAMLHQGCVRDARRLRGPQMLKADHRGFHEDEWHDPVVVAERDLAWFTQHRASVERDAPAWAAFLFRVVDGVLRNRIRLHQEMRQVLRKGYLTVNTNPLVRGRFDFDGEEQVG